MNDKRKEYTIHKTRVSETNGGLLSLEAKLGSSDFVGTGGAVSTVGSEDSLDSCTRV